MESIPNIQVKDTSGTFDSDMFKIYEDKPATTAWLTHQSPRRLNISASNVRYSSVPNINGSTYKTFLTYNGTLGYPGQLFSAVIQEDSGIFDINKVPVLEYSPGNVYMPDVEDMDDIILDIKMYDGVVDIIRYSEGILDTGDKTYRVKSTKAYPTQIKKMPNISGKKVILDGWYSFTHIVFRNISPGSQVIKDTFYGYEGFIFKASNNGTVSVDSSTGEVIILVGSNQDPVKQTENSDYKEILFSLDETEGYTTDGNNVYIHSQILVMDEIRDAITEELVASALDSCDGTTMMNWGKLSMKRAAANVMFQNGLYEKAQIILESARAMCGASNAGSSSNCC